MKNFFKIIKVFFKNLLVILLLLILILSFQYYHTEIYNFTESKPFTGKYIYNPYQDYEATGLKANFHAHSNAWNNITNGKQTPDEVINHYKNKEYDIISLSDYNKINVDIKDPEYISTYEHGMNFGKRHQLVIGADYVKHFDFYLFQNKHHKQQIIKKIKSENSLISLAHPKLLNAYTSDDLIMLRGVTHLEILNHYKSSTTIWDQSLSNGKLLWALSGDDSHDIEKPYYTFVNWNRIGVSDRKKNDVMEALAKGNHYSVTNKKHCETNFLDSCILNKNCVTVYFKNQADRITFIGDQGIIRKDYENCKTASYTFSLSDTYIRIEAETGSGKIFLNPLIRYNGKHLPIISYYPEVNLYLTILYRVAVLGLNSLIMALILLINGALVVSIKKRKSKVKLRLPKI